MQDYDAAGNLWWRASGLSLPPTDSCDAHQRTAVAPRSPTATTARNRLTSTSYGDGSPAIGRSYTPDGLPLQVWVTGANPSMWTYTYYNRRLLRSETLTLGGVNYPLDWGIDANGHVSSLSYADPGAHAGGLQPPMRWASPRRSRGSSSPTASAGIPTGRCRATRWPTASPHSSVQNVRGLPEFWNDAGVVYDRYLYDRNGNVNAIVDLQQNATSPRHGLRRAGPAEGGQRSLGSGPYLGTTRWTTCAAARWAAGC